MNLGFHCTSKILEVNYIFKMATPLELRFNAILKNLLLKNLFLKPKSVQFAMDFFIGLQNYRKLIHNSKWRPPRF